MHCKLCAYNPWFAIEQNTIVLPHVIVKFTSSPTYKLSTLLLVPQCRLVMIMVQPVCLRKQMNVFLVLYLFWQKDWWIKNNDHGLNKRRYSLLHEPYQSYNKEKKIKNNILIIGHTHEKVKNIIWTEKVRECNDCVSFNAFYIEGEKDHRFLRRDWQNTWVPVCKYNSPRTLVETLGHCSEPYPG